MSNNVINRAKDPEYNGNVGVSVGNDVPLGTITKNKEDTKEVFKLKSAPIQFKSTCESTILTTIDIGKMVNGLFKKVFKDYDGCTMFRDPQSNLWKVALYFKENVNANNATDGIKNIERIGVTKTENGSMPDIGKRIEAFASINSNKAFNLTKGTIDVISKYYLGWQKNKDGNINLKPYIYEGNESSGYAYNSKIPYVQVSGLDLIELLKDIYGCKNDEDHYIEYEVNAIRPLAGVSQNNNYLMQLTRYDSSNIDSLATRVGIIPVIGQLPIIR